MISGITVPEHWHTAGFADIERELCALLTDKANVISDENRVLERDVELMWAFAHPDELTHYFRISIREIKASTPYARWLPLSRSRALRAAGALLQVRWSAQKLIDTPVRGFSLESVNRSLARSTT